MNRKNKSAYVIYDCFFLKNEPQMIGLEIKYMFCLFILLHVFFVFSNMAYCHWCDLEKVKNLTNIFQYDFRQENRLRGIVARLDRQHQKLSLFLSSISHIHSEKIQIKNIIMSSKHLEFEGQANTFDALYQWRDSLSSLYHKRCFIGSVRRHRELFFHLSCPLGLQG